MVDKSESKMPEPYVPSQEELDWADKVLGLEGPKPQISQELIERLKTLEPIEESALAGF